MVAALLLLLPAWRLLADAEAADSADPSEEADTLSPPPLTVRGTLTFDL